MKTTRTTIEVRFTWSEDDLRKMASIPSAVHPQIVVGGTRYPLQNLTIEWEVTKQVPPVDSGAKHG